jgi:1-aminocyclopropane-1-carboxylate deaminase/D-cysteine desulfhydrase-like pyridoxal-dependent ACC family enzyme
VARSEGLFLDPIYSGKAFAGLIELLHSGEISGAILFWHTGGIPTLFANPHDYHVKTRQNT